MMEIRSAWRAAAGGFLLLGATLTLSEVVHPFRDVVGGLLGSVRAAPARGPCVRAPRVAHSTEHFFEALASTSVLRTPEGDVHIGFQGRGIL